MWIIRKTPRFEKKYKKLPSTLKKKFLKQLLTLQSNFWHPSLYAKKMDETNWEARVDYHYRFSFSIEGNILILLSIGMYDEGLGKK